MRFSWTLIFIVLNLALFVLEFFLPLVEKFAFSPAEAFNKPWTFVTSIFLHAHKVCNESTCSPYFNHILFNMFALFVFGLSLEANVSQKTFFLTYISAGIIGNLAYLLADPSGIIPAIGASGAIYGIMGALTILRPGMLVYVGGMFPIPMVLAAFFWIATNFIGLFHPSTIAYQAHLGGIFIGIILGIYLRLQRRRERNRFSFAWWNDNRSKQTY